MVTIKSNLQIADKKSLFVLPVENNNIYLSSRNLQDVSVVTASDLNTYQILNAKTVVILEGSVKKIEEAFNCLIRLKNGYINKTIGNREND